MRTKALRLWGILVGLLPALCLAQGLPSTGPGTASTFGDVTITDANGSCTISLLSGPKMTVGCPFKLTQALTVPDNTLLDLSGGAGAGIQHSSSSASIFVNLPFTATSYTANIAANSVAVNLAVDGARLSFDNANDWCAGDGSGHLVCNAQSSFGTGSTDYVTLAGGASGGTITTNGGTLTISAASGSNLNLNSAGGGKVQINGSAIGGTVDAFMTVYDQITAVGTTGDIWLAGPTISSLTIKDVNYVVPIVGGGTGTLTSKLCTVAGCGSGTTFVTCSIACNAAAAATGTCTVNVSAVPASTTLHYAITGACTTADVTNQVAIHYSQP